MKRYFTQFSLLLFFILLFNLSDAQVMRVINNRVGINANSPAYHLHVGGDMYGQWIRTAGQRGLYSQSYGIYLQALSTNYWVSRSDRGLVVRNRAGNNRGYLYHDNANGFGLLDADGAWSIRMQRDSYTQFAINNISRMVLRSTGRLDIQANIDASGGANTGSLQVGGALRIDGNEMITNTNSTLYLQNDNNGDLRVDATTLWVDASANQIRTPFIYDANNTAYYLNPNSISRLNQVLPSGDNLGYVGTNASTWNRGYFRYLYRQYEYTLSDRRAKENIEGIDKALDKVLALDGMRYNYKASVNEGEGMLDFDRVETDAPEIIEISNNELNNNTTVNSKTTDHKAVEGEEGPEPIVEEVVITPEILIEQEENIPARDVAAMNITNRIDANNEEPVSLGFIAQDVQKVVPEAVTYDPENDVYSMNYSAIIPLLVEGMKEQQKMIEAQQKEIKKLQSFNTTKIQAHDK